jgi:SAM-dependent methyltransferase
MGAETSDAVDAGPLPGWLAIALVVGTSAAVLVLEILAGRLLAPYVGVSLETYTGIIGTVLTGIAIGAWAGGALADRVDPRRLVPVLLVLGGALAIATIPVVRVLGDAGGTGGGARIVVLTMFGFLPSATVLSAVPPAVVKLQLRDLATTGTTVGRLSAYGTAGAIVGTFLTGFVLVTWAAVTTLVVAVGVTLVVAGIALWWSSSRFDGGALLGASGVAALSLVGVAAVDAPCEVQTAYYCVSVVADPDDESGRTLVLDDLRHSYVDLDDPTNLRFWYVRRLADGLETEAPPGPIDVVHLGAGGLTLPRYVRATRPGSEQAVLEIDPDLIELVEDELGFMPGPDVDVVIGDGRLGVADLTSRSADVVVGDAFGSRSVPWQLATEEFVADVARVLRPGGLYAVNIIDEPDQRFLRAEAATFAEVFPHVVLILGPDASEGRSGNSVILASDEPIDVAEVERRLQASGDEGRVVDDVDAFVSGARVLTDDFAPVDQLIASGD